MASVNTNIASLIAQLNANRSQTDLTKAITRLSSGLRINSAADDAAGLAISDRFTAQIRGIDQAVRNANDAISLAQTADGSLSSISDNLQRIRELAVESGNATNSASDRASLQLEASQLVAEIDRVATQTQYNGINLLDGSFSSKVFQVGANVGQTIAIASIANVRTSTIGIYQGFSIASQSIGTASNTPQALAVRINGGAPIPFGSPAVDAAAIAGAINAGGVAGLTATANATNVAAATAISSGAAGPGTAVFTINGVAISIAGTGGTAGVAAPTSNRTNAVAAINAQSASTGVIATDTGTGVSLAAADGRNITTAYSAGTFTGSTISDFGFATTGTTGATVNISYVATPGTTSINIAQTSGMSVTQTVASTGTALSAIDISTMAGANAALFAVDAALATVGTGRATVGAVQNRFASAVSNLQTTGENLSAARGRIVDADFAEETANLTRAQVLQQAGLAMIAQANQLPSQVLQLLRQ